MSRTITVTGLDLASVNSGYCRIEARTVPEWPPIKVTILDHRPIELIRKDCIGRFELAPQVAELAKGSDIVAVEDYAMRVGSTNTTAYQCGEFVGPTKAHLLNSGLNLLLVPTTTMRSMLHVPTGKDGKKFIMRWVEENFGFAPEYGREKQRSDVADAFVHAYIGAIYWFATHNMLDESNLNEREHRIFYGNPDPRKTKRFVGLLERDNIFIEGELYNGSS